MSCNTTFIGPPMDIATGYPFAVKAIRLRTGTRTVYVPDGDVLLRIGQPGEDAVLEVTLTLQASETDPYWYLPDPGITAEQTDALGGLSGLRYVVVDATTGWPLLEGAVSVRSLPL